MSEDLHRPDLSALFCQGVDHLLYFVPVDLAEQIDRIQSIVVEATTWGDLKRKHSRGQGCGARGAGDRWLPI